MVRPGMSDSAPEIPYQTKFRRTKFSANFSRFMKIYANTPKNEPITHYAIKIYCFSVNALCCWLRCGSLTNNFTITPGGIFSQQPHWECSAAAWTWIYMFTWTYIWYYPCMWSMWYNPRMTQFSNIPWIILEQKRECHVARGYESWLFSRVTVP